MIPADWVEALHERYAPHTVPDDVVTVAEAMTEVADPRAFGPDHVPDVPPDVVWAAVGMIDRAGLTVGPFGDLVVKRESVSWDPLHALEEFENVTGPPEGTAPTVAVAAPSDPPEDDDTDPAASEPRGPDQGPQSRPATRTPEREADYRTALHDTTRAQLSSTALLAGLAICQRCWKSGKLFATQATLAEWMHLANTKSVRSAVAELEAAGFLTLVGTAVPNRPYHYRLTIPTG